MKLNYYFTLVLFMSAILGCSSAPEISKTSEIVDLNNVTPKNIISQNIEIIIPYNWSEIKDNSNSIFEIWLVNNEASAVISFIPINFNSELKLPEISNKIDIIKDLLISKKKSGSRNFSLISDEIISSNYQMKSIRYVIDDKFQNSILFGEEDKYYECLAYFSNNYNPTSEEIEELVETQKQIVNDAILK